MAIDNGCPDFDCDLSGYATSELVWRQTMLALLQALIVSVNSTQSTIVSTAGLSTITSEGGYPQTIAVPSGGSGITVLPANSDRRPGSYIQNLSDTYIEFNYATSITPGSAGILAPGGVLDLSQYGNVYTGAVRMYQASGSSKNVYVASFVPSTVADINPPIEVTSDAGFPAKVDITTGGTGVTVLAANALRAAGSYIQNISDTTLEFNYGTSITPGEAGTLAPGGVIELSSSGAVYKGAVRMYQNSGVSKSVWVTELVPV